MSERLLELIDVTKVYLQGQKEIKAVDSLSCSIDKNEFVLINGVSGSGKSTLLYIMSGMLNTTSGEVLINGKDLSKFDGDELTRYRKEYIGFVFQHYNLISSLNSIENVVASRIFDRDKKMDKAEELLHELGLIDRINHLPSELSGGEKQRVAIARALINDPEIIFADEPTGNLDEDATENIIQIFKDLSKRGKTIIFATHEKELFDCFDSQKIILSDGRRVEEDG